MARKSPSTRQSADGAAPQRQSPPSRSDVMQPRPADEMTDYVGRGLLAGKVATVGQQAPIGRAAEPAPTGGEIHPS